MSIDIRLTLILKQLRLPTVLSNYQKLAMEAEQNGQKYEEYLLALLELALLESEANQRELNSRKYRISEARFPMLRTMEEYDFGAIASLNQSKVLQLSKGEYIPKHENIALIGGIGTGHILLIRIVSLPAGV